MMSGGPAPFRGRMSHGGVLVGGTLTSAICVGRLGVQYSCPCGGGVERAGVVGVGCRCAVGCLRERATSWWRGCFFSRPAWFIPSHGCCGGWAVVAGYGCVV